MKTVDTGEFFQAKQENTFTEYKQFSAEEYYTRETAKSPSEVVSIPEVYRGKDESVKKTEGTSKTDTKELKRQYEKLTQSQSTSTTTHAASTSAASSAAHASAASTAGAVGASTVAVAAIVIFAVASVGIIAGLGAFLGFDTGMDFFALTVDMGEVLKADESFVGLTADDFYLEVTTETGTEIIRLRDGTHTYLLTGLQPDKSYSYSLICENPSRGSSSTVYSDTVTTPRTSDPRGVYDELNNSILYDDATETATVNYSVYLSDYEHKYSSPTLYLCSAEQNDLRHIENVVYASDMPDERGFFRGSVPDITADTLHLYLVGTTETPDGQETHLLFSHVISPAYPADWERAEAPLLAVDESEEQLTHEPDRIVVTGKLTAYNPDYEFCAFVNQYDGFGNPLCLSEEASLSVDPGTMTYTVESSAYYGVATYAYILCAFADEHEAVPVYESAAKTYTASQDFIGSYTKVLPQNATVTYDTDHITVSVRPEFTTDLAGTYYYKLQIINSAGTVYGEYEGQGDATIDIYDWAGLDTLCFAYYDCGSFPNREVEYDAYLEEGVPFCVPSVSLSPDYGFNGQYFTLSYTCDMVYDYANASLDLSIEMDTGDGITTVVKQIDGIAASGVVILDNLTGAPGNVSVTATLSFKDNQSDGATHTLGTEASAYAMDYRFSVTGVSADISQGASAIPVVMKFDCQIPSNYSISIKDTVNGIDLLIEPMDEYYFAAVPMDTASTLTVQVVDKEGVPFGEASTYTISQSDASTNYTVPYMFCVNPGDAVVTYNDDGTINIYRKIDFSSDDSRIYYNAFVYNSSETDAEGRTIFTGGYDCIGRDTYAVLENLPLQDYFFRYYVMFAYEGVDYIMNMDWPSGGVIISENPGTAKVSQSGGSTTVQITMSDYGKLDNKILCDGTEYTYTTYTGTGDTEPTLVINGEETISEVVIFFTDYDSYYNAYSTEIVLKGSRYRATTITVEYA